MTWVEEALPGLAELREREEELGTPGVRERLHLVEQAYLAVREAGSERPLTEMGSGTMESATARAKGTWVLWMLRDRVGEPLFAELLVLPDARQDLRRALIRTLTERAGEPAAAGSGPSAWVDPFFDFWVYGTGLPDHRLVRATARSREGGYSVTLRVANEGTGAFPVPVVVQTEEGARHLFPVSVPAGGTEEVEYALVTRPVSAAIDPDLTVLSGGSHRHRGWQPVRARRWWIF